MTSGPHRNPARWRGLVARVRPGDAAAYGTPAPRRRSVAWRLATPMVGLLVGALFVVSAHSSEGSDLRPGRYTDLASLVRGDAAQVETLRQRVGDLNSQIGLLSGSVDNKQVTKYRRQASQMRQPAGLMPAIGPGVTVTLSDAPQGTDQDTPDTVDNPNLLLVHQQDIQAVVNAMWKGGAEAVTIQGQRVVSTTGIRCIGNAVQLQGVPYSQPYVISAVGDPTTLQTAIAVDPYLQVYRADAENPDINVGWDEVVESRISAPGYDGLVGLQYARPLPSADANS